ncbi:hypothetical protein H5410_003645 [Solanum commersonii]|uniref:Polyprotein n=1 Tax=Solanum commersonii TaxID=4109 RepID=A0A9J6B5K9_SOLCO|nr:hypothetical protein H5410_003645 [Solanum commersonii]
MRKLINNGIADEGILIADLKIKIFIAIDLEGSMLMVLVMDLMVVVGRETMVMVYLMGNLTCFVISVTTKDTREPCYKLHGYPKRKGVAYTSHANIAATGGNQFSEARAPDPYVSSTNNPPTGTQGLSLFTPEQYTQILQLLSKGKEVDPVANVATTSTAGIITTLMSGVVNSNWIVDTGASNHMVHNLNLMNQYTDLGDKSNMNVNLPTGVQVPISHIVNLLLEDLPDLPNLMSG